MYYKFCAFCVCVCHISIWLQTMILFFQFVSVYSICDPFFFSVVVYLGIFLFSPTEARRSFIPRKFACITRASRLKITSQPPPSGESYVIHFQLSIQFIRRPNMDTRNSIYLFVPFIWITLYKQGERASPP